MHAVRVRSRGIARSIPPARVCGSCVVSRSRVRLFDGRRLTDVYTRTVTRCDENRCEPGIRHGHGRNSSVSRDDPLSLAQPRTRFG